MAETDHYCTPLEAAQLAGNEAKAADIQEWWLYAVEDLIEQHTGQGYKARARTYLHTGTGNQLIRLPSIAASVESITEEGRLMSEIEYRLDNGRYLTRRTGDYVFNPNGARWYRNAGYIVNYTEPDVTALPQKYRLCAAMCVAQILMFAKKHKEYGIALTASDQASAGKVSTGASTSFPASLVEELSRTIKSTLKKLYV